ncbi:MAG: four-carbon acid sugar kinase family protein [Opitutaceae bacterium]
MSPRRAVREDGLLLAFYGDDFTGSTDALEFLERAGMRTVLFLEAPTPARLAAYPGLRAVGVAGATRALPPDAIEERLRPALARLRGLGAPHVHYKVCSTFDSSPAVGSIGRAIDVAADVFHVKFVPLLVGTPALGRYCIFGNLFARVGIGSDGPIHRLDRHPVMSRHPTTPARDSDLRRHLARQTDKRVGLFDILQVALPPAKRRAALDALVAGGADVVLFDILEARQFEALGGLIDAFASREQPLFSVGSSGIESALTAHWAACGRIGPARTWPKTGSAMGPLLVVSGSSSGVTGRQIEWAVAHGYAEVPLDTAALLHPSRAIRADAGRRRPEAEAAKIAADHLRAGRSVIVHTSRGHGDPRLTETAAGLARGGLSPVAAKILAAERLGSTLGRIARAAFEHVPVRRLLVAGGDTSSYAARALGIESVEMASPLLPGAPLCRARAPGSPIDGREVAFKGGQLGSEDYFELVRLGCPPGAKGPSGRWS